MLRRDGSRRLSLLVLVAIGLILVWRLHERQTSSPASPSSSAAHAEAESSSVTAHRDLARDEREGGHTLGRHVGRSESELAARLAREAGVAAASTFPDRATAEAVVGATLARESGRIGRWLSSRGENLALDYRDRSGRTVGVVLRRGAARPQPTSEARVVLRRRGDHYFVLTAYPVEP